MFEVREAVEDKTVLHLPLVTYSQIVEDKLKAVYDHQTRTLNITWKGDVSSGEFRDGYVRIAEIVRSYKPTKWLLNLRERGEVSKDDRLWIFKNFFPKALRLVRQNIYMAVILPVYAYPSMVHQLDGDELIYEENFMIIEHFLLQDESMKWLQDVAK